VHSVWDDHDFLWNDTSGGELRKIPAHQTKIHLSTAFQRTFRLALSKSLAPGSFPPSSSDPAFWHEHGPRLETPSIALSEDVWLHLLDVRSFRTGTFLVPQAKRTILGAEQRIAIEQAIMAEPDALHVVASGTTFEGWRQFAKDSEWLLGLAALARIIFISGDIHRNNVASFATGRWPMHETTASGAAIRDGVRAGDDLQNFGLLDVGSDAVEARFFSFGRLNTERGRVYDRVTWVERPRTITPLP
jgi:alkaline phosphatase D